MRRTRRLYSLFLIHIVLVAIAAFSIAVPKITVTTQSIGEGVPAVYAAVFEITEESGNDLYNHPVRIVIGYDEIPAYNLLEQNTYVTDENGTPLYYWVEAVLRRRAFIWVKIPRLPANGRMRVIVWYGAENNPYEEYNDPKAVFTLFSDLRKDDLQSEWENYVVGMESNHVDYNFSSDFWQLASGALKIIKTLQSGQEAAIATKDSVNVGVTNTYYVEFRVKFISGYSRPIEVGLASDDSIWGHTYIFVSIDNRSSGTSFYSTGGLFGILLGDTVGTRIADAPVKRWIRVQFVVSPAVVYARALKYSTDTPYFDWTLLDRYYLFYGGDMRPVILQRVMSNDPGTATQNVNVDFVIVRPAVYPEPSVSIVDSFAYITMKP